MPQFHFSLQQLLDLRVQAEDQARCGLATSQHAMLREQGHLDQLERCLDGACGASAATPGEPVQPHLLLNNALHLAHLRLQARVQEARVQQCAAHEASRRHELAQAARQRQVIERLKERRQEQYVARQEQVERGELEESATMTYLRQRLQT